jgi:hypothetical protein
MFAFSMCNVYKLLFNWSFFLYKNFISLFTLNVRVCVSVSFAAIEWLDVFILILAYLGIILCAIQDLLKYMSALQFKM